MGIAVGELGKIAQGFVWTPSVGFGLGAASFLYALGDLQILPVPHPQINRQVPISCRRLPMEIAALLYGVPLGMGIATRIISGVLYITLLGCFVMASPLAGALCMGLFGFARGLAIVFISLSQVHSCQDTIAAVSNVMTLQPTMKTLSGISLAAAGTYLVVGSAVGTSFVF